jgi:hypothetical protein
MSALAVSSDQTPEEYEKALRDSGQVEILSGDILRNKVIDRLVEAAVPVDENGNELTLGEITEAETTVEAEATVGGEGPAEDAATEDEE